MSRNYSIADITIMERSSAMITQPCDDESNVQDRVAESWKEVLKVDSVPYNQSFFEAGGTSLLLFELQAMLFVDFDMDVDIVDLFDNPTIEQQADLLIDSGLELAELD